MFTPINLTLDYGRIGEAARTRFVQTQAPRFGWGVRCGREGARQGACRVVVGGAPAWDSGWVDTSEQSLAYAGPPLPRGEAVRFEITLRDEAGVQGETVSETLYLAQTQWNAPWIGLQSDAPGETAYLRRDVTVRGPIRAACLYACGLGYHKLYIDGRPLDGYALEPAHTDYAKTCQYVMVPGLESLLGEGAHCLGAMIGDGWRRAQPVSSIAGRGCAFFGKPCFTAMLRLSYADGGEEWIFTDETWQAGRGAHWHSNLFLGETYDATRAREGWSSPGFTGFEPAIRVAAPGGVMRPMLLAPIAEHRTLAPLAIWPLRDAYIVDFGHNIAGVVRMRLGGLRAGQTIRIRHAEELNEDGDLFRLPLRQAESTDTYIASGDARDLDVWQPMFTYHGFRYARIEGLDGPPAPDTLEAVELHSAIELRSAFRCGNALVSLLHTLCVDTERHNAHGILTDCPQRDERQGWMNDATVRFEGTPFILDVGRMFPKIIRDILDTQAPQGSIACTAPFVFGSNPADPVCSSFLVAGLEAMMHTGNLPVVAEAYDGFKAWTDYLYARTEDGIVDYSYYGDWAGPQYACEPDQGARSIVTPGVFMSTGYLYYNCRTMARFARWLGKAGDAALYEDRARAVREAMLAKWYDPQRAVIATGSQGCQSFALWLGLLPQDDCPRAARHMRDDLVRSGWRMTTGNLCTRYLLDTLADYGYVDDAWALLTREEYPSYGYMVQQEATTIWERFELKKNPGMNSHSHPMYGSVDAWLFRYIAGIRPTAPGFAQVDIRPYAPGKLLSAQAVVDTVKGELSVRWAKRYGALHLMVSVPCGVEANISLNGVEKRVRGGFHTLHCPLADEPEGSFPA